MVYNIYFFYVCTGGWGDPLDYTYTDMLLNDNYKNYVNKIGRIQISFIAIKLLLDEC